MQWKIYSPNTEILTIYTSVRSCPSALKARLPKRNLPLLTVKVDTWFFPKWWYSIKIKLFIKHVKTTMQAKHPWYKIRISVFSWNVLRNKRNNHLSLCTKWYPMAMQFRRDLAIIKDIVQYSWGHTLHCATLLFLIANPGYSQVTSVKVDVDLIIFTGRLVALPGLISSAFMTHVTTSLTQMVMTFVFFCLLCRPACRRRRPPKKG